MVGVMKRMAKMLGAFAAVALLWVLPVEGRAMGFDISGSREGERLSVQIEYDGSYGRVSACVFRVEFEPELVDFAGAAEPEDGYLVSTVDGNILRAVYSSRSDSGGLKAVDFEFKPRKGAETAAVKVEVRIEQVAAEAELPEIPPVSVEYEEEPVPSSEARLLTLKPDNGELEPEFSPEITEYEVSVPYEVEELHFGLSASPGAKVSVNRRKLGSGGSDTLFKLSVTAEDGISKQVYTVNVHRGEYVRPTPKPTATPRPTNSPKPTATPKAEKTPAAAAEIVKTPKPSASPKAEKAPKPSPAPKGAKTPVPKGGEALEPAERPAAAGAPLTEVITIEREKASTFDRLATLSGIFAGAFGAAAAGTYLFEKLERRVKEKGKERK